MATREFYINQNDRLEALANEKEFGRYEAPVHLTFSTRKFSSSLNKHVFSIKLYKTVNVFGVGSKVQRTLLQFLCCKRRSSVYKYRLNGFLSYFSDIENIKQHMLRLIQKITINNQMSKILATISLLKHITCVPIIYFTIILTIVLSYQPSTVVKFTTISAISCWLLMLLFLFLSSELT